eukprot:NODE_37_length_2559_cov_305.050719.p1 GENE.NODE_37_length_2559_cov_305.050719~~NODE_37_length_2559_cov_305.050719.p1  ORF type:complete len:832 (+),score=225.14 NODE_37_length_2559_cov_305.050719:368-2497(+)
MFAVMKACGFPEKHLQRHVEFRPDWDAWHVTVSVKDMYARAFEEPTPREAIAWINRESEDFTETRGTLNVKIFNHAEDRDAAGLRSVLDASGDPHSLRMRDGTNFTALQRAARSGNQECCDILVKAGLDPRDGRVLTSDGSRRPIHADDAVRLADDLGHTELADCLLSQPSKLATAAYERIKAFDNSLEGLTGNELLMCAGSLIQKGGAGTVALASDALFIFGFHLPNELLKTGAEDWKEFSTNDRYKTYDNITVDMQFLVMRAFEEPTLERTIVRPEAQAELNKKIFECVEKRDQDGLRSVLEAKGDPHSLLMGDRKHFYTALQRAARSGNQVCCDILIKAGLDPRDGQALTSDGSRRAIHADDAVRLADDLGHTELADCLLSQPSKLATAAYERIGAFDSSLEGLAGNELLKCAGSLIQKGGAGTVALASDALFVFGFHLPNELLKYLGTGAENWKEFSTNDRYKTYDNITVDIQLWVMRAFEEPTLVRTIVRPEAQAELNKKICSCLDTGDPNSLKAVLEAKGDPHSLLCEKALEVVFELPNGEHKGVVFTSRPLGFDLCWAYASARWVTKVEHGSQSEALGVEERWVVKKINGESVRGESVRDVEILQDAEKKLAPLGSALGWRTPLQHAAHRGHRECCDILIKAGLDPSDGRVVTSDGSRRPINKMDAAMIADDRGNTELFEWLLCQPSKLAAAACETPHHPPA